MPAFADEGDLDQSFANKGTHRIDLGSSTDDSDYVWSVAIGDNGRIYGAVHPPRAQVLALTSDGAPVLSYGNDGVSLVHPDWDLAPLAAAQDSAGRLVLAGSGEVIGTGDVVPWVTRLDASGEVDSSFADDGHLFVGDVEGRFDSVWVDGNGKIVAVGNLGPTIIAARFLGDGSPDPSFGNGGVVMVDGVSNGRAVHGAPGPGESILVTGSTTTDDPNRADIFVLRLRTDGTVDPEFGTVTVDIREYDQTSAIVVTSAGRIVVAGYSEEASVVTVLTRLLPSGDLDKSLQGTGMIALENIGTSPTAHGLVIDETGRIILAGNTANGGPYLTGFVARLRANGSLDPAFGSGGFTLLDGPGGQGSSFFSVALQSDGKIVAGGNSEGGMMSDSLVARFDASTPDISFVDDDDSVFENAIEKIAAAGITVGCNPPENDRFCPNDHVTRGQMAAFLVRAIGYTDDGGGGIFDDTVGNTFELAIDRLATAGVTVGCNPPDNDRFCPDDRVTRGQMAAFLVRALGYSDDGGGDLFVDDDESVFERAIDRLATAGVTLGCNPPDNDRFCPNDRVTRGQMAAFLARALGLP
jgi:uncharacterized delta-60 repeat protein